MASKNTLDKLFGSRVRVKILKFMFRNHPANFGVLEVSKRTQEPLEQTKKELVFLTQLGLINKSK